MELSKAHYIHTQGDGRLGETNEADVKNLIAGLAEEERIVLHFHGGLVKKERGKAGAVKLLPGYQTYGHPIFFVWESGLLEAIRNNLGEIAGERIFKKLTKKLHKHTVGQLTTPASAKAVSGFLQYPTDITIAKELKKLEQEGATEPFDDLEWAGKEAETREIEATDAEIEAFVQDLEQDPEFQEEVRAIAAGALDEPEISGASAKGSLVRSSQKTLMSPEIIEELRKETQEGQKGLLSTAKMIWRAARILKRVFRRLRRGRDHGIYTTIVEEILREYYVANIGTVIWNFMKKDTHDTFESVPGEVRGGRLFVDELGKLLAEGKNPRISLVGHSAGCIFIASFLQDIERCRLDPDHPWPQDFRFQDVIFLAPALAFEPFEETILKRPHLYEHFRMFTMQDERERKDRLVPVIYPRSLLYFISGLLETDAEGDDASDRPLVGMERYYTREGVYQADSVKKAREFVAADDRRAVWSVADRGDGLRSNAVKHGGFDEVEDNTTMESVLYMLKNGV